MINRRFLSDPTAMSSLNGAANLASVPARVLMLFWVAPRNQPERLRVGGADGWTADRVRAGPHSELERETQARRPGIGQCLYRQASGKEAAKPQLTGQQRFARDGDTVVRLPPVQYRPAPRSLATWISRIPPSANHRAFKIWLLMI